MTDENTELASMPELVIVSGMSGAGRTEAMHSFEDLGYFCVDNLPSSLIGNLLELTGMPGQPDEHRRLAVVCDARNRDFFANLTAELAKLKAQGIEAVVVLVHEGGTIVSGGANGCTGVSGAIVDIAKRLDPAVDLVVSGHTHQAYNCLLPNKASVPVRVTSAGQYGRMVSDIDLVLDTRTHDVRSVAANNISIPNNSTVAESESLKAVVTHYQAEAQAPATRVIGRITATLSRDATAAGESSLGDVIADAQLDATDDVGFGEAVVALMNPGGIRADLPYSAPGKIDGQVTYGEAFTVQPFGNSLVTMTLTGADLKLALEQQFTGCTQGYPVDGPVAGQPFNRMLQVSGTLSYAFSASAPACNKIGAASLKIKGVTVNPAASYRITVNSFLADGGDQFYALRNGTQRLGGAVDTDAFEAYLRANPTGVAPGPRNRYTQLP